MPRQARKKSKSGIYHIMLRGINQQILFEDDEDRAKFLDTIKKYKQSSGYCVLGYCLMDNHVHLLIKEGNELLENTMKRIGVSYVFWYNWKYKRSGHLFQDRFKSEPIEDDRYLLTVLKYIHQNPVKAGLAADLTEYKWSSYSEYISIPRIVDSAFVLGIFQNNQQQLQEYFNQSVGKNEQAVLDMRENKRHTDEAASGMIQKAMENMTLGELRQAEKTQRDEILRRLKELEGLSVRQIARITGFTVNIVAKAE